MKYAALVLVVCLLFSCGCGEEPKRIIGEELTFTNNILETFQPLRDKSGGIHFVSEIKLPHDTKVMLTLRRAGEKRMLGQMRVLVRNGAYPISGILETAETTESRGFSNKGRPHPKGRYSITIVCYFSSAWQNDAVLKVTQKGQKVEGDDLHKDKWGSIYYEKIVEFEI